MPSLVGAADAEKLGNHLSMSMTMIPLDFLVRSENDKDVGTGQGRIQNFSQGWAPGDGLVLECY